MNQRRRDIQTATKRVVALAGNGSLNAAHAELLSLLHRQPQNHALREALVFVQEALANPSPARVDLAFLLRRMADESGESGTIARITPTRRKASRSQDVTATGLRDARAREISEAADNNDSCDMLPESSPKRPDETSPNRPDTTPRRPDSTTPSRPDTLPRPPGASSNPTLEVPTIDDSTVTNSISSDQGEVAIDEIVQRIEFLANEGRFEDAYDLAEMMMATAADDALVRGAWKYAREVRFRGLVERLVPLSRVPILTDRIPVLDARLEPGTMFVLGLVDGYMNIEDIIDISGLPQADAMAGLLKLLELQLIKL